MFTMMIQTKVIYMTMRTILLIITMFIIVLNTMSTFMKMEVNALMVINMLKRKRQIFIKD